jgi:hypothetical protein
MLLKLYLSVPSPFPLFLYAYKCTRCVWLATRARNAQEFGDHKPGQLNTHDGQFTPSVAISDRDA